MQHLYVTTAISYPNGRPHMGHAYEAVSADVVARFARMNDYSVKFQTGTDEHGLKMARKALELGVSPIALADEMSAHFREMCDALNISYDRFIRTTDLDHTISSQSLWRAMRDAGDLYLDKYEGWYSVRDEDYYTLDELITNEQGEKISPLGTPVEWTVEECWFFRLSKYQDRILDLLKTDGFVEPVARRNEMIAFVERGLRDLSISRTSFDWGVKVPDSDGHIMYVWVDALANYLTGIGYPNYDKSLWENSVHIIGKDITRFHAIYWTAFLMSAGVAPPSKIFSHGFLLNGGQKEAKSVGNVTDPLSLSGEFGVDCLRYFLMREVPFGQDGNYSNDAIAVRTNAELANGFGNLAQRTLAMIAKNLNGSVIAWEPNSTDLELEATVSKLAIGKLRAAFEEYDFSTGIEFWKQAVDACNKYIDTQAPWVLSKHDTTRMGVVLMTLYRQLYVLAVSIRPVIPEASDKLLSHIGVPQHTRGYHSMNVNRWYANSIGSFTVTSPLHLFPRYKKS